MGSKLTETRVELLERSKSPIHQLINTLVLHWQYHYALPEISVLISSWLCTSGYMAPEYAMHGLFSSKSDVFSFGVLVLEIVSGKKNNSFHQSDGAEDLLSYVS